MIAPENSVDHGALGQSRGVDSHRLIAEALAPCIQRIRDVKLWSFGCDEINGPMLMLDVERAWEGKGLQALAAISGAHESVVAALLGELAGLGYFGFSHSSASLFGNHSSAEWRDQYLSLVCNPDRAQADLPLLADELAQLAGLTKGLPLPEILRWTYMGPQGLFRFFDQGFSSTLQLDEYLGVQRRNLLDKLRLFAGNEPASAALGFGSGNPIRAVLTLSPGREESKTGFNLSLALLDHREEPRASFQLGFSVIPTATEDSIRVHRIQTSRSSSVSLSDLRDCTNAFQSSVGAHPHQILIRGLERMLGGAAGALIIDDGLQNYWLRYHQSAVDPRARMELHAARLGYEYSDRLSGWIRGTSPGPDTQAIREASTRVAHPLKGWFRH